MERKIPVGSTSRAPPVQPRLKPVQLRLSSFNTGSAMQTIKLIKFFLGYNNNQIWQRHLKRSGGKELKNIEISITCTGAYFKTHKPSLIEASSLYYPAHPSIPLSSTAIRKHKKTKQNIIISKQQQKEQRQ